jgi:hypothetical protein
MVVVAGGRIEPSMTHQIAFGENTNARTTRRARFSAHQEHV